MALVDVSKSVVELQSNADGFTIRQLSRYETLKALTGYETTNLRITHTTSSALKTPLGHKFLALGMDSSGDRDLALVPSHMSVLKVPVTSAVPYNHLDILEASLITVVAAHLTSMAIISPLVAGQRLLCHNTPIAVAQAITARASAKGIDIIFTTDRADSVSSPSPCIRLPPYLARSDFSEMIPSNIACFVNFSDDIMGIEVTMLSILSSHCRKENIEIIYSPDAINTDPVHAGILRDTLQNALGYVTSQDGRHIAEAFSLDRISGGDPIEDPSTIIDWTASTSVLARITRLDKKSLFKNNRTYWLCGLSGALGISLCDWMIDCGVRCLVLTSRNPKIDPAWIAGHKINGVSIKVLRWYVSHKDLFLAVPIPFC